MLPSLHDRIIAVRPRMAAIGAVREFACEPTTTTRQTMTQRQIISMVARGKLTPEAGADLLIAMRRHGAVPYAFAVGIPLITFCLLMVICYGH